MRILKRFYFFLSIVIILITGFITPCSAETGSDPEIVEISSQTQVSPGFPFTVLIDVKNNGTVTSGLLSTRCFLMPIDDDNNVTFIGVATGDPLSPEREITLNMTETVPIDLVNTSGPGPYQLYVKLTTNGRDINDFGNTAKYIEQITLNKKSIPKPEDLCAKIADEIYLLTNDEREKNSGLKSLTRDKDLDEIALNYTKRMVDEDFFAHVDPDGQNAGGRAESVGYPTYKKVGEDGYRIGIAENLAYMGTGTVAALGYIDPINPHEIAKGFMTGWMKSSGHRKNILEPDVDKIGIGVSWSDKEKFYYASQEFY